MSRKTTTWTVVLTLITVLGIGRAVAAGKAAAGGSAAADAFAELKKLEGDWTGTAVPGQPAATVRFKTAQRGSVLVETFSAGTPNEMQTLYHLDGAKLVATHYCVAGNQPQMSLSPAKSKAGTFVFGFTGGTNLKAATDLHMHGSTLTVTDADHFESTVTTFRHGKLLDTAVVKYTRSK